MKPLLVALLLSCSTAAQASTLIRPGDVWGFGVDTYQDIYVLNPDGTDCTPDCQIGISYAIQYLELHTDGFEYPSEIHATPFAISNSSYMVLFLGRVTYQSAIYIYAVNRPLLIEGISGSYVHSVPIPVSLVLLLSALAGLTVYRRLNPTNPTTLPEKVTNQCLKKLWMQYAKPACS